MRQDDYPVPPTNLQHRLDGKLQLDHYGKPAAASRDMIERYHEAWLMMSHKDNREAGERRYRNDLIDLEAWEAECRAVDERFNVPALKAAQDRERDRFEACIDEIAQRPAQSVVGIAVKLAMARYYSSLNQCDELESACDDALRLAGLPADMGEMRS